MRAAIVNTQSTVTSGLPMSAPFMWTTADAVRPDQRLRIAVIDVTRV